MVVAVIKTALNIKFYLFVLIWQKKGSNNYLFTCEQEEKIAVIEISILSP